MRTNKAHGFTLIELLMVIAIIGILASILIPTVRVVREKSKIAASRIQLNNYVNSIQLFKSEYNFYPFVNGNTDTTLDLSTEPFSREFIETLSGRDASGDPVTINGNRRSLRFTEFGESEYYYDNATGNVDRTRLADRFNNPNIHVLIDGDGNGLILPVITGTEPEAPANSIRANVTIWVEPDAYGSPGYGLWE